MQRGRVDVFPHPPYRPEMDRRTFLLTSLAGALTAPTAAEAQQAERIYRIGIIANRPAPRPEIQRVWDTL